MYDFLFVFLILFSSFSKSSIISKQFAKKVLKRALLAAETSDVERELANSLPFELDLQLIKEVDYKQTYCFLLVSSVVKRYGSELIKGRRFKLSLGRKKMMNRRN